MHLQTPSKSNMNWSLIQAGLWWFDVGLAIVYQQILKTPKTFNTTVNETNTAENLNHCTFMTTHLADFKNV